MMVTSSSVDCGARILLPLDQVEAGETKIPVTIRYARMMGAQVVLLHVLRPHALDSSAVLPEEARARAYLDTIAAQIHAAGLAAAPVVRSGLPARIIIDEAETIAASLIILGANVRSKLATLLTGSVADEVLRSANCPVLLVHPGSGIHWWTPDVPRGFRTSLGAIWVCARSRSLVLSAASLAHRISGRTFGGAGSKVRTLVTSSGSLACLSPPSVGRGCRRSSFFNSDSAITWRMGTTAWPPRD